MHILLLNGEIPLHFVETKKYNVGTGYIALYNKKESSCILCRYLEADSTYLFEKLHILCDCSAEPLTNESVKKIGKPVLILTDKASNFNDTDKMVESYKKGLTTLQKDNQNFVY